MTKSKLAAFLIGLAAFAQTTRSVWEGVYTDDQSKRGQAIYAKECAGCHGAELTGGESAPPLAGGEFLSSWNGLTAGDLFDRIRQTMPLAEPGKLSRQQYADTLAFIFQANRFPTGKTELDRNTEALKLIKIDQEKK